MKPADVIDKARPICGDNHTPFREADEQFILWLNDGVTEVTERRPDAAFANDGTLHVAIIMTDVTDTIPLNDTWLSKLVDYVCFRFYSQNSSDENNLALSKRHEKAFYRGLS